ncbi:inner membrane protein [Azospirillum brasilense]|uniref:Inner membrane protein n=1 Tax=Azospirillum brasilense TaxID=192 RepID=A0A560B346_AZOBR|nr:mitofilin family membrane protein [Azospirillum brasilense]TWA67056.1 inner membrane protein [Azospirillum brasilense]
MTSRPGSEHEADPNGHTPSDQNQTPDQNQVTGGPAVERIIERFGGIRPMAHKLDIPVTTVQGWKKRGAIPLARHADLRASAAKHRIKLSEADLEAATPSEDRNAPDAAGSVMPLPPPDAPIIAPAISLPGAAEPIQTGSGKAEDTLPGADTLPGGGPVPATDLPPSTLPPVADTLPPSALPGADTLPSGDVKAETIKGEEIRSEEIKEEATTDSFKGDSFKPDPFKADTIKSETPPPVEPPASAYTTSSYEPPRYEAPREERKSGAGFATAVSLIALLVGAAALSQPWWGPRVPGWPAAGGPAAPSAAAPVAQPDPALRNQIQQLTERLAKLEQRPAAAPAEGNAAASGIDQQTLDNAVGQLAARIQQLEERPQAAAAAAPAEPDPRVAQLTEQLGQVQQRVDAVGNEAQAAGQIRQEVDALKQELAAVNQAVETRRDAATAAQTLVLAAGQLRSALAAGQPFQQELQAVRAVASGDAQVTQPLEAVAGYAAKGVPTQPQLTDRFTAMASDIVRADNQGEGNDWVEQVTGKIATLVTVRRSGGDAVGDGASAVVARAEAALQAGNLGGAVKELAALKGPAAQVAAPWIADAKARLAANEAGQQLTNRAIGLLSQSAGVKGAAQ